MIAVFLFLMSAAAGHEQRFFDTRVAPVLVKRCLGCHNAELMNGGISFVDRESLLKGGPRGAAVVPGKPEASVMIQLLRPNLSGNRGQLQMPPGAPLSAPEVRVLTEWVRRGAVWGLKRP